MANQTPRFGLTTFDKANDTLDHREYKFGGADRVLLDRLITTVVEQHRHSGAGPAAGGQTPAAPTVTVTPTGGVITSNTSVYYQTALVDETGLEHVASQVAVATTPPPVFRPDAPTVAADTGGTLMVGTYTYAASASTQRSTNETTISATTTAVRSTVGGFTIGLPAPPSGATAINVYRKAPTDGDLRYLTTVPADVAAIIDDGTLAPDPLRGPPVANSTAATNSIEIKPTVATNGSQSWKLYRTFDPLNWDNKLLAWTTDNVVVDTGHATTQGSPLSAGTVVGSPPKIALGAETTGTMPPQMTPSTDVIHFTYRGPVRVGAGPWQWINDYDYARIRSIRANLGGGSTPDAQPVRVALERMVPGTSWRRYTDSYNDSDVTADIPVGQSTGERRFLDPFWVPDTLIYRGYALRPVIAQSGAGAHTDTDLNVTITLAVRHGTGPPPTQTATMPTMYTSTFDGSDDFQRIPPWKAASDGAITDLTINPMDASGWQAHLNVLVNGTVVYTSDPFTLNSEDPFTISPTINIAFLRDDELQIELVPAPDAVGSTYETLNTEATISGYVEWPYVEPPEWLPVGVTGDPYDIALRDYSTTFTQTDEWTLEVDLPAGIKPNDLLFVVATVEVPEEDQGPFGPKVTYRDGSAPTKITDAVAYTYVTYETDPRRFLLVWIGRHTGTDTAVNLKFEVDPYAIIEPNAGSVAFIGADHLAQNMRTYDGVWPDDPHETGAWSDDQLGLWLHVGLPKPSPGRTVAANTPYLIDPLNPSNGVFTEVQIVDAGISVYSPEVFWYSTPSSDFRMAAVVMQLVGRT